MKSKMGSLNDKYIFFITIGFYFILWFLNPGNKLIFFLFALLFYVYNRIFKNFRTSLILCFLASLIILVGKTYQIQLLPESMFKGLLDYEGYNVTLVITPTIILGFCMLMVIFRDWILGHKRNKNIFSKSDVFLFLYFLIIQFVDAFVSHMPVVSSLLSISNWSILFAFIFIKLYKPALKTFIPLVIGLLSAQVIFQSSITLQQFSVSSPLGKSIESHLIYYGFGGVPDEITNRFRPMGTFSHANNLAAWLVFVLLIIFYYNYKKNNVYYFLVTVFGSVALILTLSRGAWISYFIGIVIGLYYFEKIRKIKLPDFFKHFGVGSILLALTLLVFFIFPRAEKSLNFAYGGLEFRQKQLKAASSILQNNLIFGVGTGMSLVEIISSSPKGYFNKVPMPVHNWYVVSLIEHGILSLFVFILFILLTLRSELKSVSERRIDDLSTFRVGFVTASLSLLIVSYFQPFMLENILILTCAILGKDFVKTT